MAITPRSLDMQAADAIREEILSGSIAPGSCLLETELSERLKLSRGTIRAALQQLTYEGLVVQIPYRGCAVAGLSARDAWELYTLRNALEGLAARLAAEAMTVDKASLFDTALQALIKAVQQNSWQAVADADFALHKTIVRLSEHRRLQEQYTIVEQQIKRYIAFSNALLPNLDGIVEEHKLLVEAICLGNAAAAEQITKEHNADGKALIEYLQRLEQ